MSKLPRRFIDPLETDYIRALIDMGDNERIKIALQRLCQAYRSGAVMRPDQRRGVINAIIGTAYQPSNDEKVRRWVLNALARAGDEHSCIPAIVYISSRFQHEPQTVAAGVAALYKICQTKNPGDVLSGVDFDPVLQSLSAMQHVDASTLDLSHFPVQIDNATSDILRLALIVVGLDKSPGNLFHPRFSDAEMVRALGGHHDPIVSQYSVWAVTEHPRLGFRDLGVAVKDIEFLPANVRAWLLQLLASEANAQNPFFEEIRLGTSDNDLEVRRGLARGLRNTYLDVLEPIIIQWLFEEPDAEVRSGILDHMIINHKRSRAYEQLSIEIYDKEPAGSMFRQRMNVAASGTSLFGKFQAINVSSLGDLFSSGAPIMVKNVNIGNINGAVSFGEGDAVNYGSHRTSDIPPEVLIAFLARLEHFSIMLHRILQRSDSYGIPLA